MAENQVNTAETLEEEKFGKGGFSNGRFWFFLIIAFAVNVVQFMSNGSVSNAANAAGMTSAQIGIITSIMGITAFLMAVIAGPATLVAPPHIIWGICCVGYSLSYFLLSRNTMAFYIIGKVIDGIVSCFQGLVMIRILRDRVSQKGISQANNFYQMRNSGAKILGPLLGLNGFCIWLGYTQNFLICSAVMLVLAIIIFLTMKVKNTPFVPEKFTIRPTNIFTKGSLFPMLIITCCILPQMAMGQFNTVFAKTQLGATNIGFMMAFGNIFAVILAPILMGFVDKVGFKRMLILGFCIFLVGPIVFANASKFSHALVGVAFQYVGFSLISPCILALLVKQAPPDRANLASNAHGFGMSLGSFFGPLLAGYLVQWFGYRTMYWILPCFSVLGIILVFVYYNKITKGAVKMEQQAS